MDPRTCKGLPSYLRYSAACVASYGYPNKFVDMSRRAIAGKSDARPIAVHPKDICRYKPAYFMR